MLAFESDGKTLQGVAPGTGAVASAIANDSQAPGLSVADSLTDLVVEPSFAPEVNNGASGAAFLLNYATGPAQSLTLTANCTVAVGNLIAGRPQWLQLKVIQGGGGGFTMTITGAHTPGGAGLALSAAAGATDLVSLYWDGAVLFATVGGLAFS
ncbi:MAG TPA: hypothetical protein VNM39_13275 [Verrucomicrobiae bacterium]|nr:hypothetical protein [Verrucomicrobiae bacterium]